MPVARDQISELLDVLAVYFGAQKDVELLLVDLLATAAAKKNSSFRVTIERLLARVRGT